MERLKRVNGFDVMGFNKEDSLDNVYLHTNSFIRNAFNTKVYQIIMVDTQWVLARFLMKKVLNKKIYFTIKWKN